MSKKSDRQSAIIVRLSSNPTLRVGELAEEFGVTGETIRRDLDDLSERGSISRTYGGAVLRPASEPSLSQRHKDLVQERTAIAYRAANYVKDASVLMIGSGATTTHVARRLATVMKNATVVTHSFSVATVLSINPTIRVLIVPGLYHAGEGAMHGGQALRFLEGLNADWAILGASGVSPEGPSDALIEAAEVYTAMIARSTRRMLVCDATKFDRVATARFARWSQIDLVISDIRPTGPLLASLEREQVGLDLVNSQK
ncbi:DeoR/GlpR family DNA-binding transcription regulator [Fulvimarina sp. 2208YS6-2-32]|uniref:DeoR/GlpR family DNA-binding transcription regulator n=1 Tax=Fulvimarina uroteuthidis TaxID=3098149 RepID=A0ABU5I4K6_9HYPH|nr:DeoR/GlpR family DNA-binding transcription regulator [Fulvimarina sp. 2208YS6-2-32]MDY8110326.1 DeoR/GlpR family DNA-binding transcription regulator [Fulvimarina sp. 2208YS6-2-32]